MAKMLLLSLMVVPTIATSKGCWTWEAGHSTIQSTNPNPKTPNARCCSQTWEMHDGTVYMFGGAGTDYLSDMWKFDEMTKEWTYIAGNFSGNSGSHKNYPSARNYASTWTSPGGKLWMFSGTGSRFNGDDVGGLLPDLWSFDTNTNVWTERTTAIAPPPRNWGNFWSLDDGTAWIHGGTGKIPPKENFYEWPLSDLWRFDSETMTWSAIYTQRPNACVDYDGKGDQGAVYPGARSNSYTTVFNNKLYLYGGEGCIGNFSHLETLKEGDFQDVWEFSPQEGTWAHIAGPKKLGGNASYGTKGASSSSNIPPAEHAGYIGRNSLDGSLWFLAGENGREVQGMRNDLWSFNLTDQSWTWQAGANHYNGTAIYGTMGQANPDNTPAARYAGQMWTEPSTNEVWIFGGYGFDSQGTPGYLDDVWKFSSECSIEF